MTANKLSIKPTHRVNLRADAAWMLFQILEQGKSSRDLIPIIFARHKSADKAWLQEMVFGCMRNLPKLQFWLRQMLAKPLKNNDKQAEHVIMLGLYQLAFSRTSVHASVAETAEACRVLKLPKLVGLVNAVLRNFLRQDIQHQSEFEPWVESGLPRWLYKRLQQAYPNDIDTISQQSNAIPPLCLRVNTQRITASDYRAKLDSANIAYQQGPSDYALLLRKTGTVSDLPGFQEGLFSIQDLAAQQAAQLLAPKAGDKVLDCCAAPGGKSTHLLELQPNMTQLTILDNDALRMQRVSENIERLLDRKTIHTDIQLSVADASTFDAGATRFDKILVDVPCSATGVIRRHPDIRWHRKWSDIEKLLPIQQAILQNAWRLLAPNGVLLYATCSILPEENHLHIRHFLNNTPDARLLPIHEDESEERPGWQILPGEQQMDGFYYARLVKSDQKHQSTS